MPLTVNLTSKFCFASERVKKAKQEKPNENIFCIFSVAQNGQQPQLGLISLKKLTTVAKTTFQAKGSSND